MKHCKLWDLNTGTDDWKSLIKWSENLETIYLWNVVITDADLDDMMALNKLRCLQDFKVGSSEIGYYLKVIRPHSLQNERLFL